VTKNKPARRPASPLARLRPFWVLLVVLVVAAGAAGYYAATWKGFLPKRIVIAGNRIVPAQEIAQGAAISPRLNIWLQNTGAEARRVAAIPYIASVRVHRIPPATIQIAVTERVPYAIVRTPQDSAIIDRDLRVLEPATDPSTALPFFVVKSNPQLQAGSFLRPRDLLRLRADYQTLRAAHVAVASEQFDRFGDLVAITRTGVHVMLGDDGDLAAKARMIDPILSQAGGHGRKIASVDLRSPRTPVVVYR